MPRERRIELKFPLLGLERRSDFQPGPGPFFTPSCLNVRGKVAGQGRARGGTAPGLDTAYYEQLGSGSPVRLLNTVQVPYTNALQYWADEFSQYEIDGIWQNDDDVVQTYEGDYATIDYGKTYNLYRDQLDFQTGSIYYVQMFIAPWLGKHYGKYRLFARIDNSQNNGTADPTNGVVCELYLRGTSTNATMTLRSIVAGVSTTLQTATFSMTYPEAGWFTLSVSGTTCTGYWKGTQRTTGTCGAHTYKRVGFGLQTTEPNGRVLVDTFRLQAKLSYTASQIPQTTRNILIAGCGGNIYQEDVLGQLATVSTTRKIGTRKQLTSFERASELFIADYDDVLYTGTAGVRGTGADRFVDAGVADWTTLGISPKEDFVLRVITAGVGQLAGVYAISTVASGELTLSENWDAGGGGTTTSYQIVRSPKLYRPLTSALVLWRNVPDGGVNEVPLNCPLSALYRDRAVLGGAKDAPHLWYMSRSGDMSDWDYGAPEDDPGRAIAAQSSNSGVIGQALTAIIPGGDDYLLMASRSQLWVCRGEPTLGGILENLSRKIGVVGRLAWCYGPAGEIYFLSQDGLYVMPPGANATPQSLSRERLPDELTNLSEETSMFTMAYSIEERGVYIFATHDDSSTLGSPQTHFFFDVEQKAFWPGKFSLQRDPTALLSYQSDCPIDSCVLIGGVDGYVRRFHRNFVGPSQPMRRAYVCLGPFMAWDSRLDGVMNEIRCVMGESFGKCIIEVIRGDTPEECIRAVEDYRTEGVYSPWSPNEANQYATLSPGLNYSQHLKTRGPAIMLKISTDGEIDYDRHYGFGVESVNVTLEEAGPILKG